MTQRTIGPDGKDELREREQLPQAGQWWRDNLATHGESTESCTVRIYGLLPDGQIVVELLPGKYFLWKDMGGYYHEPRCTGWDWIVPENQSQSEPVFTHSELSEPTQQQLREILGDPAGGVTMQSNPAQPAESPDDWVIQDRVPIRVGIDRCWYMDGHSGLPADPDGMWQKYAKDQFLDGKGHGDCVRDCGGRLHVMCRRRDLPPVTQQATVTYTGKGVPVSRVDDEPEPQPKRKTVRLWKFCSSETVVASTIEKSGDWQELKVDPATGEFFVNED